MRYRKTVTLLLVGLLLSSCKAPAVCPYPAPPTFANIANEDMLDKMSAAVTPETKGLVTTWLYDYAATCEGYRSEALACQAFIKAERK
jgi:hypothetical protein